MVHIVGYDGTSPLEGYEYIPLDGDSRKLELLDPAPDSGVNWESPSFGLKGKGVISKNMPTRLMRDGPGKFLRDIEYTQPITILLNEKAQLIIERIEPDVHQFWPMEIWAKDRTTVIGHRSLLMVCNRLNSINSSQTSPAIHGKSRCVPDRRNRPGNRLVFNARHYAGKQLWAEKRQACIAMSDELQDAFSAAGVTGTSLPNKKNEIFE